MKLFFVRENRNRRLGQPDSFDVTRDFENDPWQCISKPSSLSFLRGLDFGWRPWVGGPEDRRITNLTISRWIETYHAGLSAHIRELITDDKLGEVFADLLMGFQLVVENASPGRTAKNEAKGITKKKLRSNPKHIARDFKAMSRLVGPFVTDLSGLSGAINRIMVSRLVAAGFYRAYICEVQIPKIWASIGVKVSGSAIHRMDRRHRQSNLNRSVSTVPRR